MVRLPAFDNEVTIAPVELGGARMPVERRRRLPSPRAAAAVATLLASAAVVTWIDGLDWTPGRILLVFAPPALVFGRGRRYVTDWVPFALLILLYAECRGLAHLASPHPYYRPQLWLERHLFGGVPAVWLQSRFWHGTMHWWDHAASICLGVHFVAPPLVAFALWMRSRALFFRFATSMIVLSFSSAVVFLVYPSAPPWAAAKAGLLPGVVKLPPVVDVSSLGTKARIPANPYAAIPSLHAGYALLTALTVAGLLWASRLPFRRTLAAACFLYPLVQTLAVIYTGNHYVVDILIGFAFAYAAYTGTKRAFARWLPVPVFTER